LKFTPINFEIFLLIRWKKNLQVKIIDSYRPSSWVELFRHLAWVDLAWLWSRLTWFNLYPKLTHFEFRSGWLILNFDQHQFLSIFDQGWLILSFDQTDSTQPSVMNKSDCFFDSDRLCSTFNTNWHGLTFNLNDSGWLLARVHSARSLVWD